MGKRYGIGLFAAAFLMLAVLSFAYYKEYTYHQKLAVREEEPKELTVDTVGDAKKEEIYYLKELNGYLVVYQGDGRQIYEYTNIRIEELPEELKDEIAKGKEIEGKDKLYGFLENYSS